MALFKDYFLCIFYMRGKQGITTWTMLYEIPVPNPPRTFPMRTDILWEVRWVDVPLGKPSWVILPFSAVPSQYCPSLRLSL